MSNSMPIEDQEQILAFLNDKSLPFEGYRFIKGTDGRMIRLGGGGFGSVYACKGRVEDLAIKAIGFQEPMIIDLQELKKCEDEVWIQAGVGKKCREIVQIRDARMLCIRFDEAGNPVEATPIRDAESLPFNSDDDGLFLFISMELLQSVVIREKKRLHLFDRLNPPKEEEILRLAVDICKALRAAHSQSKQIIHRDVKPENIFWDETIGVYKLGDFGIARTTLADGTMTMAGTNGYVAPEVLQGSKYGVKADMYSYGIMLYCLLNDLKIPSMADQLSGKPLNPPKYGSAALQQVVLKACSYNPADRYDSMDQLLQALEQVRTGGLAPKPIDSNAKQDFLDIAVTMKEAAAPAGLDALPLPEVTQAGGAKKNAPKEGPSKKNGKETPAPVGTDALPLPEVTQAGGVKKDAPKKDTPKKDTPKKDTPKKDSPKKNAPKKNAPKADTPKKAADDTAPAVPDALPLPQVTQANVAKKDTPKKDIPQQETPKQEAADQAAPEQKPAKSKFAVAADVWEDIYDSLEDVNYSVNKPAFAIPFCILAAILGIGNHAWVLPNTTTWQFYVVLGLSWICSFLVKKIDDDRHLNIGFLLSYGDLGEIGTILLNFLTIGFMLFSLKAVSGDWLLILLGIFAGLGLFSFHLVVLVGVTTATAVSLAEPVIGQYITIPLWLQPVFTAVSGYFSALPWGMLGLAALAFLLLLILMVVVMYSNFFRRKLIVQRIAFAILLLVGISVLAAVAVSFVPANIRTLPWGKLLAAVLVLFLLMRFLGFKHKPRRIICLILILGGAAVLALTTYTQVAVPQLLVDLHLLRVGLISFGVHLIMRCFP